MSGSLLLYAGAIIIFLWGSAHLLPTRTIVRDFGPITTDNRRIITMEWVTEGVALMFIGVLVALVTSIDASNAISTAVSWAVFAVLNVLSIVSLCTAFRNSFIAFKVCPFVFTVSSLFILAGTMMA